MAASEEQSNASSKKSLLDDSSRGTPMDTSDPDSHLLKPESVYNIDEETRMGPDTTGDSLLSIRSAKPAKTSAKPDGEASEGLPAPIRNAIAAAHPPSSNPASFSALSFIASEYAESDNSSQSPSAGSNPEDSTAGVDAGDSLPGPGAISGHAIPDRITQPETAPSSQSIHLPSQPSNVNIENTDEGSGGFTTTDDFEVRDMCLDNERPTCEKGQGKEAMKPAATEKLTAATAVSSAQAVLGSAEKPAFQLPRLFGKNAGLVPGERQPVTTYRQVEKMDFQESSGLSLASTTADSTDDMSISQQVDSNRDSLLSYPEESVDSPGGLDSTRDVESSTAMDSTCVGDTSVTGFSGLGPSKADLEGDNSNMSLSLMDESSQSKDGPPRSKRARRMSRTETDSRLDEEGLLLNGFPAERLFEYQWPQDGGEWYLLQEQLSEYLAVKSFKRKHPDLTRRVCDKLEKDFLREQNVVTEHQCDMGLTALRSDEVYDLMMKDYPDKYHECLAVLHQRQKQTISEKHKEYEVSQPKVDKSKIADYMKKAARSAAEFNKMLLRDRREERRAYFDLQTFNIQFPVNRYSKLSAECTKPSPYPVGLFPGQFQDYYCSYTSDELRYFPINTALYDPPKKIVNTLARPNTGAESSEEGEEKTGTTSESGSGSAAGPGEPDARAATPPPSAPPTSQPTETPAKTPAKRGPKKGSKSASKKKKEATEPEPEVKTEPETPAAAVEAEEKPKVEDVDACRICTNAVLVLKNKKVETKMIKCSECGKIAHPTCLDLTEKIVQVISTYPWQCMECKTCVECMDPHDEDKMLFCDRCDRGYHTFCVGLRTLPSGRWECRSCKGTTELPKSKRGRTLKKTERGDQV